MAINNWVDYSRAPIQDSPFKNLLESVLKGYQIGQEPARMRQEQLSKEEAFKGQTIGNKLKQLELENKPAEMDLQRRYKEALIAAANTRVNNKGQVIKPNGEVANIAWVREQLKDPDIDPEYAAQLKEALQQRQDRTSLGNERIEVLNKSQAARSQTNQGKLLSEQKDVADGYVPGTDRTQKFDSPEIQKFYENQYALKLQKERSDAVTRNRAIYAGLVDRTFDNVNVDRLVRYSGIEGEIEKRLAQGQLVPEKEQEEYKQYKEEMAKVQVLAKQIRQFYGDSISPSNLQKLESISNPAKWNESPAAAKAQFEAFKNIVKQETGIYRKSLSSIEPFQDEDSNGFNGSQNHDLVYNPRTGRLE